MMLMIRSFFLLLASSLQLLLLPIICLTFVDVAHGWMGTSNSNTGVPGTNKYNVVLEPTIDDPKAFDSFRIGSAKVHRYSRNNNNNINMNDGDSNNNNNNVDDTTTEYVMWYHGRSVELNDKNQLLPPLSTGRIGRATSRNGLVWKKQTIGSPSEDVNDVSLGLNKESWWSFDTTHVGIGSILLPMSTPAVMTEGGVYLLYYMGGNGEETYLHEYMDNNSNNHIPESVRDVKLQGMKMKIGVALSQDGISFGRVEGDDPSGAILVPTDKSEVDQKKKKSSSAPNVQLEEELYCGWPEVVVNVDGSPNEAFIMYYSTMLGSTNKNNDKKQKCIAYATSSDGFRWYKQGVCLSPDDSETSLLDAKGCARCSVMKDAEFIDGKWIEKVPISYTMYYEGVSSLDNKHRIMQATSKDGKKWTKLGLVLDIGQNDNDWDHYGVGSPHIIRLDDGSSRMYYTGQGSDGSTAVGVAKDVDGSGVWIREQATISFSYMDP